VSLPEFNRFGDLPPGLHLTDLEAVRARFGDGSRRRVLLFEQLERIWQLSRATGKVSRFIVFGSFVSTKLEPNDVDVFLLMEDSFDVKSLTGETRLVFDHSSAQSRFEASIFWLRRMSTLGGEDVAIDQWGIKRDGNRRGIIEIVARST
jgi:hypothetical protein